MVVGAGACLEDGSWRM